MSGSLPSVLVDIDGPTRRIGTVRSAERRSDPVPAARPAADDADTAPLHAVAALVAEHGAVGVVVGLPRTLAGREGPAAEAARAFAVELEQVLDVPVELSDERLTTVVATRQLRESGRRGRRQRAVVDQVAAVGILQGWLDRNR